MIYLTEKSFSVRTLEKLLFCRARYPYGPCTRRFKHHMFVGWLESKRSHYDLTMMVRIGGMFPMSGYFMWIKTVWSKSPGIGYWEHLLKPLFDGKKRVKNHCSQEKKHSKNPKRIALAWFCPGHRQGWQHHQDDSTRERRACRSRGQGLVNVPWLGKIGHHLIVAI